MQKVASFASTVAILGLSLSLKVEIYFEKSLFSEPISYG